MGKRKNAAAVELGRRRAATMTRDERQAAGAARIASLTPEERSALARKAAAARWSKRKKK